MKEFFLHVGIHVITDLTIDFVDFTNDLFQINKFVLKVVYEVQHPVGCR